jgi:penicillin-binding protein 2
MSLNINEAERQINREKIRMIKFLMFGALMLLGARFIILQVIFYHQWHEWAENSQLRRLRVPPLRGNVYAIGGEPLAEWRHSFNVTVIPADVDDESFIKLGSILDIPPEILRQRMERNKSWSRAHPALIAVDISRDRELPAIEVNMINLSGVDIEVQPARKYYPESILTSHVLGYLGEVNDKDLAKLENSELRPGDRIGKTGIEKSFDYLLRGEYGVKAKLVDARGKEISLESDTDFLDRIDYKKKLDEVEKHSRKRRDGVSVALTIDIELQRIATKHMKGKAGSVVAMDVKTGDLLCLLSMPLYDPELFVGGISSSHWNELMNDPDRPMFNKSIQGIYEPASIFKIIVAAAGLEEGVINNHTRHVCDGLYELSNTKFACWKRTGHGSMNLHEALVQSCDVYFYELGYDVGVDNISKWARGFGLGNRIGIEIGGENSGLIPDRDWKRKHRGRPWYVGDTINMAIGQGATLITPLQAVLIPAAVANNGKIMKPRIVHHLIDVNGRSYHFTPIEEFRSGFLKDTTLTQLKNAMIDVVEDKDGTAYKYAKSDYFTLAGKTGTAEVTMNKKYRGWNIDDVPYDQRDHAWFICFAPVDNPDIALAVLVEHGGSGGKVASTIASDILEEYIVRPDRYRPPGR